MQLTPSLVLYGLEIIGFFVIGSLAILRQRSQLHVTFCLFAFSLGLWQLFQLAAILSAEEQQAASVLLMTSVACSALMATSIYLFACSFVKITVRYWLLLPSLAVGSLAYFSDGLAQVVITSTGIGIPTLDMYYGTILLFNLLILIVAATMFTAYHQRLKTKRERDQTKIIIASISIGGVTALLASFYTSDFSGSVAAQQIIPMMCLFVLSSFLYAMTYTRLFDIKIASVRTLAYILSLASLAGIYYFVAYVVSILILRDNSGGIPSIRPINIALALLLAFIFQPIRAFFDKITDRIFFRNRYNPEVFYEQLSEVLTSTTDLRTLTQRAAHEISSALKASDAFFFVRYGKAHHITAGTTKRSAVSFEAIRDLDAYCANLEERLIVTDLLRDEDSATQDYLKQHNIAILMPLVSRRSIIGYLFLGEQKAGGYTNRDIRVLRTISDQLTIAIQNSLSIQEVRDVNQGLQQRIDTATKELRTSNLRLKKLDLAKNEFLSMASHQLRTPLTSMKGYVSMVLEGDAGEINPTQRKLLEQAFTSSQRMVYLIGDFLNVSRLQTGKFELEKSQIDLAHLIEDEVEQLETTAKLRAITLRYEKTCNELILQIDATKLRQVIMNFIDNALYYSPEGTTVVVRFTVHGGNARFEVRDQGIGVPKVEQHNLFTKFYRASNAKRTRPDGTGIGLFMAKKVIIAHGGSMLFESREGKGSTFGFVLPVKNQRSRFDNKPDNQSNDK